MDLGFEVISSESDEWALQGEASSSGSELVLMQDGSCVQVDLALISGGSLLVPRQCDWPDSIPYSPDLEVLADSVVFHASANYLGIAAPSSADPTQLLYFLDFYPFHVETLQQLSVQYEKTGLLDMAQSTLEHLLFAFQIVLTRHAVLLTEVRIPHSASPFNALFLDSLQRYSVILSKRRAFLPALELSKLILSLRPGKNELAAVMMVELMALQTKQGEFLKEFHCNYMKDFHSEGELLWLPSSLYTAALGRAMQLDSQPQIEEQDVQACERIASFADLRSASPSTQLLVAVSLYPSIAALLLRRKLSPARQAWTEHTPLGSVQPLSACYADMFGNLWSGWPLRWLNAAWVRSLTHSSLRERLLSEAKPLLSLTVAGPSRPEAKTACAASLWNLLSEVISDLSH